jgi:hypothetical protein
MAVCADYHIPHSVFLSWSQSDRDKAIWWHIRKRETCTSCGTRAEEWKTDPNAYTWKVESCPGCHARELGHRQALRMMKREDPKASGLPPWQWVGLVKNRKEPRS